MSVCICYICDLTWLLFWLSQVWSSLSSSREAWSRFGLSSISCLHLCFFCKKWLRDVVKRSSSDFKDASRSLIEDVRALLLRRCGLLSSGDCRKGAVCGGLSAIGYIRLSCYCFRI